VESHVALDVAGGARIWRTLIVLIAVCAFSYLGASAQSQQTNSATQLSPALNQLLEEKRWDDIVRALGERTSRTSDEEYALGIALASLGRMPEAEQALLRGSREKPRETRFYVELGGVAFRQKRYEAAARWLMQAERLSPKDAYVNEFLGTVLYLEGNVQAALKYWNRVGKPLLENVRVDPALRVDPVVLDRAFAFSAGGVLTLEQWLTMETRLRGMGIFPRYSMELAARDDGKYDAVLHAQERNGFGSGKWEALLGTFGGVFYETVTPAYYNVGGEAMNVSSLWRWDNEKRRIVGDVSGTLGRDPKWRYDVGVDFRNENWGVRNFSGAGVGTLGSLNMRRSAGFAKIASYKSGKWDWSTGGEWSYREFRSVAFSPELLVEGHELKHTAQVNYELLRVPEKHYVATVSGSSELGRFWGGKGSTFEKLQAGFRHTWAASAKGDDLEFAHSVRVGKTFGDAPFDELFMLGLERDNDLAMRAHVGTRDGQKGNAPLGRRYFVSNSEFDKRVWSNGLIAVKAGPFVDTGKITDSLAYLGTQKWMWDAGGQVKISVLGIKVGMTYGRDLRTGKDVVYAWVGK
jgi:hypothetical protein